VELGVGLHVFLAKRRGGVFHYQVVVGGRRGLGAVVGVGVAVFFHVVVGDVRAGRTVLGVVLRGRLVC
jgi:hypothetical protein